MGYKRMILEQSDQEENDDDVPSRGESFQEGLMHGWYNVMGSIPYAILTLIVFFVLILFVC